MELVFAWRQQHGTLNCSVGWQVANGALLVRSTYAHSYATVRGGDVVGGAGPVLSAQDYPLRCVRECLSR